MGHPLRRGVMFEKQSDDGWAIYDEEADALYVLNDSARAIWELCDGSTSPPEMATAISELTGLGFDAALADVGAILSELDERGLVEL